MTPSAPQLIVGLGNPGTAYENTRHNCGFMVVDSLHQGFKGLPSFSSFRSDGASLVSVGRHTLPSSQDQAIILQKPQTYMNLSGQEVQRIMQYYKIPLDKILIIHDDIDLPLGEVRLKMGGGNGGHNGLKNITAHIGASFWRLRIGITHPTENVSHYVLSPFPREEASHLETVIDSIITSFHLWLEAKPTQFIEMVRTKL